MASAPSAFRPAPSRRRCSARSRRRGVNPVSQLDWDVHIPADWPARALLWMCSPEADNWLGDEISLRDEDIRSAGRPRMIRASQEGGLWTVTIDRPDKANSLTADMLEELCRIAEAAREARALVLTGTGSVFSAGADLDAARAGLATLAPVGAAVGRAIAAGRASPSRP